MADPNQAELPLYARLALSRPLFTAPKEDPQPQSPRPKERPLPRDLAEPKTIETLAQAIRQVASDITDGETDAGELRVIVGRLLEYAEQAMVFHSHPSLRREIDGRGRVHYLRKVAMWLDEHDCAVRWDGDNAACASRVADALLRIMRGNAGWLKVTDAAKRANVTVAVISGRCADGCLVCVGKGTRRRVDPTSLRRWMETRELKAQVSKGGNGAVVMPAARACHVRGVSSGECPNCGAIVTLKSGAGRCPKCFTQSGFVPLAQRCAVPRKP